MEISINIPEDLALRLTPVSQQLPEILELGLREWSTLEQRQENKLLRLPGYVIEGKAETPVKHPLQKASLAKKPLQEVR